MDARSELENSAGRRGIRWMRNANESMSKKEELVRSRTASEEKTSVKKASNAKGEGEKGRRRQKPKGRRAAPRLWSILPGECHTRGGSKRRMKKTDRPQGRWRWDTVQYSTVAAGGANGDTWYPYSETLAQRH